MDRAIKAPVAAKGHKAEGIRVLLPGEQAWDVWSMDRTSASLLESNKPLTEVTGRLRSPAIFGLPLQHVVVVSVWLATTDASLMEDMLALQLEKRGLISRSRPGEPVDFRVIARKEERSLLAVTVLQADFPDELCVGRVSEYRLSADFFVLPRNHLILWKELGRTVLAFTREHELVYAQSMSPDILSGQLVQEVTCTALALEGDGTLPAIEGVMDWGRHAPDDVRELGRVLGCASAQAVRPNPHLAEMKRKLLPQPVKLEQQMMSSKKRNRRIMFGVGAAYVLILMLVLGQLGWGLWQQHKLEAELSLHRSEVAAIRRVAHQWDVLEPAILPDGYPVETLYRCVRHLPQEGVRLVSFNQAGKRVLLAGEAKSAPAVYKFCDDLKKDPDLTDFEWVMPPPKLLPNDSAQFQIEGRPRNARTHK